MKLLSRSVDLLTRRSKEDAIREAVAQVLSDYAQRLKYSNLPIERHITLDIRVTLSDLQIVLETEP